MIELVEAGCIHGLDVNVCQTPTRQAVDELFVAFHPSAIEGVGIAALEADRIVFRLALGVFDGQTCIAVGFASEQWEVVLASTYLLPVDMCDDGAGTDTLLSGDR